MQSESERSADRAPRPQISIVVPVYNEEDNLRPLVDRIREVMENDARTYEVLLIDDGSRDESLRILQECAANDPKLKVVSFRRNYGQTAAMSAGIDLAEGDVIVPLDADLQNDPQDIPRLLAKLDEGYGVVSGWRKERQDKTITRKIPSWAANWLISAVTGVRLHDYGCSLKAYRADIIKDVRLYGEMHRFIPAFAAFEGAKVAELPVKHHPRTAGVSKYGLSRIVKVFLDLLVVKFLGDYGKRPIHVFGIVGLVFCLAGLASAGGAVYLKLAQGAFMHRNPLVLLAAFLFLLGMQSIMMGLLAELSIRIYHESQTKPIYRIAATANIDVEHVSD